MKDSSAPAEGLEYLELELIVDGLSRSRFRDPDELEVIDVRFVGGRKKSAEGLTSLSFPFDVELVCVPLVSAALPAVVSVVLRALLTRRLGPAVGVRVADDAP